jgi:nitroimidazol reductase NimA-like FMN-containing flavoprotein (pyridoxamine 5'-phosphate oxidase superfamily)
VPTRGVGAMTESELASFLKESKTGVLCLIDGDSPYAVPLEHVYRDSHLYFVVSAKDDRRKLRCIKRNNRACYVVYESRRERPEMIEKRQFCRSLIIEGKVTPTQIKELDLGDRMVQLQILRMQVDHIGNWRCPTDSCTLRPHILLRQPTLLDD